MARAMWRAPATTTDSPAGNFPLDSAVTEILGLNEKVVSVVAHGNANWAATARLTTRDLDGSLRDYFLKLVVGDLASQRVLGEFSCMSELFRTLPDIVPEPRGAGKCRELDAYFFLSDYVHIDHRAPDPAELGRRIAELHRSSKSATGEFGFFLTPYDGKLPLIVDWDSSWVSFYGRLLEGVYQLDVKSNGNWSRFERAMRLTLDYVIPRLLGPLEANGNKVKPCLIHGDLWEDNIGTDTRTGSIYIFDCAAFYAHHEMGIAMWRVGHHKMNAPQYRNEYLKNFPPDDPQEEFDDRNRLYSIKETIMYSALKPGNRAREQALEDMEYLIDKFVKPGRN